MPGALAQRRAGGDGAVQGAQRLRRLLGVDEPALALDVQVVGAEDLGDLAAVVEQPASLSSRA